MELIQLGRLGRGAPAVVPGPEPAAPEGARCVLCGDDGLLTYAVLGHADTVICVDSRNCVLRTLGAEAMA